MVTRIDSATFNSDDGSFDDAKQISGMAAAFSEAMGFGPEVLTLQRALVAGIAYSQEREVKRLSRTLDKSDPRLAAALDRADVFGALASLGEAAVAEVDRVVANTTKQLCLQGYVSRVDGTPAEGHLVQLALPGDVSQGKTFESTTDERGYFNIVLGRDVEAAIKRATKFTAGVATPASPASPASGTNAAGTNAAGASTATAGKTSNTDKTDTAAAAAAATAAASASGNTDSTAPSTMVRVLDEKRIEVYRDPMPPLLDGSQVWFRYYVLGMDRVNDLR